MSNDNHRYFLTTTKKEFLPVIDADGNVSQSLHEMVEFGYLVCNKTDCMDIKKIRIIQPDERDPSHEQ